MFKAILHWLFRPRYFWACFIVTAVALAVCLRPDTTEPTIRLTGLFLQLLGVLTVVWGIMETRRFFGRPPISSNVRSWLAAAPFHRPKVISAAGHASLGPLTCKARGYGMHSAGEHPTVESRLDALEKNIAGVHQRITGLEQEYDQEFLKLGAQVRTESNSLKAELHRINGRFEAFGTGGVHISAIGAVWIFAGLVLSTAAIEIAHALGSS